MCGTLADLQHMQMYDELRFWQNAWGPGPIGATCGVPVAVANWHAESHVPIIVHEDGVPHFSGGPTENTSMAFCHVMYGVPAGVFVIIRCKCWPRIYSNNLELVNWMCTC